MSDWTDGYVADIAYIFGYYQELNPLRARLPLIKAGYIPTENAISWNWVLDKVSVLIYMPQHQIIHDMPMTSSHPRLYLQEI